MLKKDKELISSAISVYLSVWKSGATTLFKMATIQVEKRPVDYIVCWLYRCSLNGPTSLVNMLFLEETHALVRPWSNEWIDDRSICIIIGTILFEAAIVAQDAVGREAKEPERSQSSGWSAASLSSVIHAVKITETCSLFIMSMMDFSPSLSLSILILFWSYVVVIGMPSPVTHARPLTLSLSLSEIIFERS